MTQKLLMRRLIGGPVMAAMIVYVLTAMAQEMGWQGAVLPSIVVAALSSFGFAWYLVRSERPQARRPIVAPKVSFIVAGGVTCTLLIGLGPPILIYGLLVAGLAMALGLVISSAYELMRGTYADAPRQARR